MASKDISEGFKGLKITENQDINILLLGETGVGKSTFINSTANYLHFKRFKKASKEELLVLIPSTITVPNENSEQVTFNVGSADNNEYQEIGAAGTQDVKTYVFPIGEGKTRLRLIDSPGLADPRGIQQDNTNCENILTYLTQLKELHAICILLKPTTTRITVQFGYCIKEILSRLEKSASRNIIFIFTNTRGTNFTPGETLPCLRKLIDDIKAQPPHVEIPLKNNIFSFDNEAFKFLVATKHGISYSESQQKIYLESWENSSKECWRLISYIVGDNSRDPLKPHQIHNTTSINEARRLIMQLSQPLADISQLVYDNIRILQKHQHNLQMENQSLEALKQKLYIPIINLEVTQLTQPVTVCTSTKCADVVKVGDVNKWHYKQRCHDPCYLTRVTKEFVGDPELQNCAAMNGTRICTKCTCDFSVHMHVYYLTKTVDDKIVDCVVENNLHKKETALHEAQRLIGEIERRKKELEQERETIIRSTAQFAHFLQHNAIAPFNDSYKAYIEYLIQREKSLGRHCDADVIRNLQDLLSQYDEVKAAFDRSLLLSQQHGLSNAIPSVTAQTVLNTIHGLYQLKHNGKKIKELLQKQKASRNSEYGQNCEYVHPNSTGIYSEEKKDKLKKDMKKDDKCKKGGSKTDDEKKKNSTKGHHFQKPNFHPRSFSQDRRQHNPPNPPRSFRQEQPPPYSSISPTYPSNYTQPSYPSPQGNPDHDPNNLVVKVELNKPSQYGNNFGYGQYSSCLGPCCQPQGPSGQYHASSNQHHGPPPNQYGYGPHQNQYQGHFQGPPSQHHGPPFQHHGPPYQHHGPPNQHHGPPQNQYGHTPRYDQYHGQYNGAQQYNDHYYQSQNQNYGPPQGGHYNRGHYGRTNVRRGGARGRGQSKPRSGKDKKSGNEKSRSSNTDSSE